MAIVTLIVTVIMILLLLQMTLLIATPNGRDEAGTSRDCFLLNPGLKNPGHMQVTPS